MNRFFDIIVTEHQQSVFGLLFSLLRDRDLAEDVTQETFLVLLRKIGEIDVSRPILPWLLTTARNLAANAQRKLAAERSRFLSGEAAARFWEDLSSPRLGVDWDERLQALRDCRSRLSPDQAEVVQLYYDREQPARSIAATLDAAVSAIHNRLARARKALHDCIQRKLGNMATT